MPAPAGSAMRGEHIARLPLQLLHQPGENTLMAAVPAGSEAVLCKVMLWLLRQPGERINVSAVPMAPQASFQALSSHLAYPASTNSADSVNSGTTGTVIRISHTHAKSSKCSPYFTLIAHLCLEQPHLKGRMASGYPLGQSRSRHIS